MPHKDMEERRDWARQYRESNREKIRKYQREYQSKYRAKMTEEEKEKYNQSQKKYRDKHKKPDKHCKVCGTLFTPFGNDKTCSDKCKKENRSNISKKALGKFYETHPDYYQKQRLKYREARGDKFRPRNINNKITPSERSKIWANNNKERKNKTKREWRIKTNYKDSDAYFKYLFSSKIEISANEIPKELLEAYKTYIQLKREVSNGK